MFIFKNTKTNDYCNAKTVAQIVSEWAYSICSGGKPNFKASQSDLWSPSGINTQSSFFLVYVNDIGLSLQHGKLVQYADGSTLCFRSNSKNNLEIESFIDLNGCIQAFNTMNLKANASKTNFINFSLRLIDSEPSPALILSDTMLDEANFTKFLGKYLDQRLTWEDHIDSVCSKISSGVYALRSLSKFCPTQVLIMAYFGLFLHIVGFKCKRTI